MSKKQVCLVSWDYMINHNENEDENESKYDINRPRSRHGHKYSKCKVSQYGNTYIYI